MSTETPHPPARINLKLLALAAGILGLAIGGYFAYHGYLYAGTDDATVEGRAILISAKVGGPIAKSNVQENQKVKKGDVLAVIRQDDYQNAVGVALAQLESMQAQLHGAESNYRRVSSLFKGNAYSRDKLDAALAQYKALESQAKGAESGLAQARLNLDYANVSAPANGRIGKKSFEEGSLAIAGSPLMGFVYDDDRWVTANMKETDMKGVVAGRQAFVEVDALSGRTFEGEVESVSPNTGATFSMLPPDNATGNYTKVVQRVPVRIKLLRLTPADIDLLQTGLSAEVSIRVR